MNHKPVMNRDLTTNGKHAANYQKGNQNNFEVFKPAKVSKGKSSGEKYLECKVNS